MSIQFLNTGSFPDNAKLTFGTGSDLSIYHNGSHSFIQETGTGDLRLLASLIRLQSESEENMLRAETNAGVYLYYDNVVKLETASGGAVVTGAITVNGGTENLLGNFVSTDSIAEIRVQDDTAYTRLLNVGSQFKIMPNDGSETLILDGSDDSATFAGNVTTGASLISTNAIVDNVTAKTSSGNITFKTNGGSTIAQYYNDLSVSFTGPITVGTADSIFKENQLRFNSAGAAYVDHGTTSQSIKFRLSNSSALDVTMLEITPSYLVAAGSIFVGADSTYDLGTTANRWANIWVDNINGAPPFSGSYLPLAGGTMTGDTNHGDSVYSYWGASNDLQIYHDGTDSYVSNTQNSGNLIIQNGGNDKDVIFKCDDGSGGTTEYFRVDGSLADGTYTYTTWVDNGVLGMGTGSDLQLYHTGTDSYISNKTGDLYIKTRDDDKDVIFQSDDGSGGTVTYFYLDGSNTRVQFDKNARFVDDAKAMLGTDGDLKLYHDGTDSIIRNTGGTFFIDQSLDDGDMKFRCDNGSGGIVTYFFLDGSSADGTYTYTKWGDDDVIALGMGKDLQLYHSGTNSYIENNTGNLEIVNNTNDGDIIFKCDDGSGGVTPYITLDGSHTTTLIQKRMHFDDNIKLTFGDYATPDLELYHDGSNSFITNDTGVLYIRNNADDNDICFQSDNGTGSTATYFFLDGDNVETTFLKRTHHMDSVQARFGDGGDLKIYHDSSSTYMENSTGAFYIMQRQNDGNLVFTCDDGSGGDATYFSLDGGSAATNELYTKWVDYSRIALGTGKDLQLYHNGTNSNIENFTGTLQIIQNLDDGDISFRCDDGSGGTTEYFKLDGTNTRLLVSKPLNLKDDVILQLGNSQDLRIYHDGNNSYITEQGVGNLFIEASDNMYFRNAAQNEYFAQFTVNGACNFRYDNVVKLETTTTGISVTGDVAAATLTLTGKGTSAATVDGDGSTTMATKGWVESKLTGATLYQGTWDPSGGGYGSPDLSTGSLQVNGYYYICSADGTAEPNGTGTEPDTWHTGDWVIWNDDVGSGEWQKIDNTTVLSGAGTGDYLARWTDTETLGDSVVLTSGSDIIIPQYIRHTGDTTTYFGFYTDDTYKVVQGGSDRFQITGDVHVKGATDFAIPAGRKFYLDGQSNTYITESSDGVIDFYGDTVQLLTAKQNGTQSEVVVNEGSGDVDFRVEANTNTHAFFVDAASAGAAAVGGSNVTYKFNVHEGDMFVGATSAAGGRGIYFKRTSANNSWSLIQGHNGTHAFELREGNDTRMYWDDGGNVGIGNISPLAKLDVSTSGNTAIPGLDAVPGASTSAVFGNTDNTVILAVGVDNANTSWLQGRQQTGTGNAFPIALNPLGGNVGIGVAPSTKLDIGGMADPVVRIKSDAGGDPQLRFDAGAANRSALIKFYDNGSVAGGFITYEHNGDQMNFGAGSSTTVTLTVGDTKVGIGTTTPDAKLEVVGGIIAGGKTIYTKSHASLNTTGTAVAGLSTGADLESSVFIFTCFGGDGYQRIVYSCRNESGTWNIDKDIDEGVNAFDVTYAADGSDNITFTFKSRSGTQSYAPQITVEAMGSRINQSYIN